MTINSSQQEFAVGTVVFIREKSDKVPQARLQPFWSLFLAMRRLGGHEEMLPPQNTSQLSTLLPYCLENVAGLGEGEGRTWAQHRLHLHPRKADSFGDLGAHLVPMELSILHNPGINA